MPKRITFTYCLLILALFLGASSTHASNTISISVSSTTILQGDPFLVQIHGTTKISEIEKLTFDDKDVSIFMYASTPSGLVAVDLNKKPGTYQLLAKIKNGEVISTNVTIGAREAVEEPLGIPEKLGGNTKASQDALVNTLIEEKKNVTGLRTNSKALWTKKFIAPLKKIHITSPYGYSRKTGEYSIPHKGTDYRAVEGTSVLASNRGVVRIAASYRNYGKSIFIDHGQGLVTYYLHLSKYKVKVGDVVERGQVIGLSGHTGYTLGAHLHFGVRINDTTIDPEKFLTLFN